MTLAASRVAIAAVFLLIVMRIVGDKLPRDGRTWRMLFVQACFNSILSWSILAWGQQHIDVALASVLNSTSPIFVFFITLALVRKAPPGRSLWGACVGLGGVALIVGGDLADGVDASLAGCAAALIGAFLYGCAAVYGKRITGPSPLATATGTMLWATLALVPVAALVDAPWRLQPGAEALVRSDDPRRVLHWRGARVVLPPATHAWFYGCGEPSIFASGRWRFAGHSAAWRTADLDNRCRCRASNPRRRIDQFRR